MTAARGCVHPRLGFGISWISMRALSGNDGVADDEDEAASRQQRLKETCSDQVDRGFFKQDRTAEVEIGRPFPQ